MPNNCENVLIVSGEASKVEEFAAAHKTKGVDGREELLDFNTVVPQPEFEDEDHAADPEQQCLAFGPIADKVADHRSRRHEQQEAHRYHGDPDFAAEFQ